MLSTPAARDQGWLLYKPLFFNRIATSTVTTADLGIPIAKSNWRTAILFRMKKGKTEIAYMERETMDTKKGIILEIVPLE